MTGDWWDYAIARIYDGKDAVVGTGFLVLPNGLLTCAHVVNAAIGQNKDEQTQPQTRITIDFPFSDHPQQRFQAQVRVWDPVKNGERGDDIAGLEIFRMTGNIDPFLLADVQLNKSLLIKGFPRHYDRGISGVTVETKAIDRSGNHWILLEKGSFSGIQVDQGFSGAPVFDEARNVVGMLVSSDANTQSAHMIPYFYLKGAVDRLQESFLRSRWKWLLEFLEKLPRQELEAVYQAVRSPGWKTECPNPALQLLVYLSEMNDDAIASLISHLLARMPLKTPGRSALLEYAKSKVEDFEKVYAKIQREYHARSATTSAHLLVSVQENGDAYQVSVWLVSDAETYDYRSSAGFQQQQFASQQAVKSLDEIAGYLQDWIVKVDGICSLSQLTIEVFLPKSCLGYAIDRWEDLDDEGFGLPFSTSYPVLLRSYERTLTTYRPRSRWEDCWKTLMGEPHRPCNILRH